MALIQYKYQRIFYIILTSNMCLIMCIPSYFCFLNSFKSFLSLNHFCIKWVSALLLITPSKAITNEMWNQNSQFNTGPFSMLSLYLSLLSLLLWLLSIFAKFQAKYNREIQVKIRKKKKKHVFYVSCPFEG